VTKVDRPALAADQADQADQAEACRQVDRPDRAEPGWAPAELVAMKE